MMSARTWIVVTILAAVIAATGSHIAQVLIAPGSRLPIGTIVAFSGPVEDIPRGWVPCDGLTLPNGDRVPNLTGRFLMGTMESGLAEGGTAEHAHQWVRRGDKSDWFSYRDSKGNREVEVDNWNNGIGDDGKGEYPFLIDTATTLYTSGESNLPPHVAVRYIIRVR